MRHAKKKGSFKASFQTKAFRIGGYSLLVTAVVAAILIVINVLVSSLPSGFTQIDISSQQLYTLSDETESVLNGLDQDIDVYWVVRDGQEDEKLGLLLDKYDSGSKHLTVTKKDPDVYPTFVQQYTDDYNDNSLIVVCGNLSRYVDYYDIYEYDYSSYYTDGTYDVSFKAESALTSAIGYVTSEDLPTIYLLTGHGESSFSSDFSSAIEQQNITTEELSLLTVDAVPEDADAVLINAPTSDLAEEEAEILSAYLKAGGHLILLTMPQEDGSALTNLEALMASYGVRAETGVVVEGSSNYYAWDMPYYLLPELESHEITSPLANENYRVILPIAQGLTLTGTESDSVTITSLLQTSSSAFSKLAGWDMTTYEKEDGDISGPFSLAVAIEDDIDDSTEARIIWISSAYLLDDSANETVSGGNEDFFLNALSWAMNISDDSGSSMTIHAKSMSYDYLTISSGEASRLSVIMVGLIPLLYLAFGVYAWAKRRHR